jgi:hypothetical protein
MKFETPLFGPCPVDKVSTVWEAVLGLTKISKREYREDLPSTRYGMEGGMK